MAKGIGEQDSQGALETLIIEAVPARAAAARGAAEERGFIVEHAETFTDAKRRLKDRYASGRPYDLVLSDVFIPYGDTTSKEAGSFLRDFYCLLVDTSQSPSYVDELIDWWQGNPAPLGLLLAEELKEQGVDCRLVSTFLPYEQYQSLSLQSPPQGALPPETEPDSVRMIDSYAEKKSLQLRHEPRLPGGHNQMEDKAFWDLLFPQRVLLIDGYSDVQDVAKKVLTENGCSVDVAGSYLDAIVKLQRPYDIIFIDPALPFSDKGRSVADEEVVMNLYGKLRKKMGMETDDESPSWAQVMRWLHGAPAPYGLQLGQALKEKPGDCFVTAPTSGETFPKAYNDFAQRYALELRCPSTLSEKKESQYWSQLFESWKRSSSQLALEEGKR